MALLDILAQLFGPPQPGNRLAAAATIGPNAEDRPGYLPPMPLRGEMPARFVPQPEMSTTVDTFAPPEPPRGDPTLDPSFDTPNPKSEISLSTTRSPTEAAKEGKSSGGGFGGFVRNLLDPNAEARNATADWLVKKGYDEGTARALASNKQAMQSILLDHYKGRQPSEFDQRADAARRYGLPEDQVRTFTLTGDLPSPPPDTRTDDKKEYDDAKAEGSFKGSFTDWQTKGIKQQDPTFQRELDLRQQYDALPEVKDYKVVRSNYERMRQGAKLGTGAGDSAIVFGYMKMLDPGSVVKEGEQANAQNAAGVPEGIRGQYNRLIGGGTLSAEARIQMLNAADSIYAEAATNVEDLNTRYSGIAGNYNLDAGRVVSPVEKYAPMDWQETEIPGVTIRRKQ